MVSKKIISDSIKIFQSCVNAVLPEQLIKRNVTLNPVLNVLSVSNETIDLTKKRLHLVGAGKAVQRMAREMEQLLGHRIKSGIISIPRGSLEAGGNNGNVKYYEGAENNLPDLDSLNTSVKIMELVSSLGDDDVLIVLISGGGSALLTLPVAPVTLQEKANLIENLANAGADIKELNTVRKKLSELKGGRLAALAQPARVVALILSDVVGDPLDLIASGPTVCGNDHPLKAKELLSKYNLFDTLPESIRDALLKTTVDTSLPHGNVSNYVIGSNRLSLRAALQRATSLGYPTVVVSSEVVGDVTDVARDYVALVECLSDLHHGRISSAMAENTLATLDVSKQNKELMSSLSGVVGESRVCLLLGGETTVRVAAARPGGRGGRSQQLALELSARLHARLRGTDALVLCAGTDGIDGPTDAAGAFAHSGLVAEAASEGLSVDAARLACDAYTFYSSYRTGSLHVKTGHTHTNVMDVHIIIVSF